MNINYRFLEYDDGLNDGWLKTRKFINNEGTFVDENDPVKKYEIVKTEETNYDLIERIGRVLKAFLKVIFTGRSVLRNPVEIKNLIFQKIKSRTITAVFVPAHPYRQYKNLLPTKNRQDELNELIDKLRNERLHEARKNPKDFYTEALRTTFNNYVASLYTNSGTSINETIANAKDFLSKGADVNSLKATVYHATGPSTSHYTPTLLSSFILWLGKFQFKKAGDQIPKDELKDRIPEIVLKEYKPFIYFLLNNGAKTTEEVENTEISPSPLVQIVVKRAKDELKALMMLRIGHSDQLSLISILPNDLVWIIRNSILN